MKLSKTTQKRLKNYETNVNRAMENKFRSQYMQTQMNGYLTVENPQVQSTTRVTQSDIVKNVDYITATNVLFINIFIFCSILLYD